MAYDLEFAERLREALASESGVSEKRMFGGLAFLIDGAMAISVSGSGVLLVPVDPDRAESLLDPPRVQRFMMRGREMAGWLGVHLDAAEDDADLRRWAQVGVAAARKAKSA